MTTTLIRNADWIVARSADGKRHEYLRDADLAFTEDRIVFVGRKYSGKAGREISGRGRMVLPGLVNIHSHPASEPFNKGLMEERGSPRLGMSSLYEYMLLVRPDDLSRVNQAFFQVNGVVSIGLFLVVLLQLSVGK